MGHPNNEHWKALECAIGYVLTKPHQGIILKKLKDLKPYIYSDSDYAKDEDDCKSMSGRISTLGGTIVRWSSKKQ